MLLEKVFTFVLFLGPLVFFHELGHFIFARLFKVRVEVFSLGFGPKLFKYKKGDTEYAISLIPLGGYVKMFGDDPFNKDAIAEEEKQFSYNHQSKWARFWIVFGGPLTNFILAFVIYYGLLISGEKIPEIKIGYVSEQSQFYNWGLKTADVINKINGKEVYNPTDLSSDGKEFIQSITVTRFGQETEIKTQVKFEQFFEELMKHPPMLRKPILISKKGEFFYLSLEKISQSNVEKINNSLEELASVAQNRTIYLYPIVANSNAGIDQFEKVEIDYTKELVISHNAKNLNEFFNFLKGQGYFSLDLAVKSVNFQSAADMMGVKSRDVLEEINGKSVISFEEFREELQKSASNQAVNVKLWRDGESKTLAIKPDIQKVDGKEMKLLGVYSYIEVVKPNFIQTQSKGIFGSIIPALHRSVDSFQKTFDGFIKLITNQVSFKNVGGVLSIGKVANDSFNISISYFLQLMALISINLGIINLFPMLPLDGGHITFIALEIINGGPISRRKMEIAQQVGLSILLMLMVGAIFNDFSRFF